MDDDNKLQFPSLPATKEDLLDWAYPMRREMQLPILERRGITHVVCVRQDIEANFIKPNFPHTFRYLVLDIADNPVENIIRFFPTTKEFIDSCLATGGKDARNFHFSYSECQVGKESLSTTFCLVLLGKCCLSDCIPYGNIWDEVQGCIQPRPREKVLHQPQCGLCASATGSRKRSLEEDEDFGAMQVTAAQNG
ncbi:Serine/threonine/tyrosine-interacting protein [Collichthys lucidus]|uniref:Serine/threonine/tyrosine-interacting protein n=1 Tax=Collichthys lucidus TaxID=240159 RepID=A0A4U5U813_COLLU|nr:Serine/threonine/tyrosine-interacting protein [Collichthys lucidus]